MADFSKLPDELIHIIFDYSNIVVYRFGKYMNRLDKNDYRYDMIKKIRRPIWIGNNKYMIKYIIWDSFEIKYLLYIHTYNTGNNFSYLTRKTVIKHDDGTLETIDQKQYIFDLEGKYSQITNYVM
jgi:hypothetical protein